MKAFSFISALVFALMIINCSSTEKKSARGIAQADSSFSGAEQWAKIQQIAADLDITPASGATLKMSSGGTSVYAVITRSNAPIGAVIPENSATSLSGEILAYSLSRALGVSELYQPGIYFFLSGNNLQAFETIIPNTPFPYKHKEENRLKLIERLQKNPHGIDTVFKKWDSKPSDYDPMVNVSANTLNTSHVLPGSSQPLAGFLKCNGPKPSQDIKVTMNKGSTSEYEAARQLSSILLIDALVQQWDRFSGGNLQTLTKDGNVSFVAYDNGGTWSTPWTAKNLSFVSRFDRTVAERILGLNRFLHQNSGEYQGLKTEAELTAALGMEKFPNAMATLRKTVKQVATHIEQNQNCFF